MKPEQKLAKAREVFFQRAEKERQVPYDLSVPKCDKWSGSELEPIPCDDYRIECAEGVREEAEHLLQQDVTLESLRRSLDFALDERSKVIRVWHV